MYKEERKKNKLTNSSDFLIEKISNDCYSVHKIIKNLMYRTISFQSKDLYWFEYVYSTIKSRKQFYVIKFPFNFSFIFKIIFNQIERRGTWISSNFRNENYCQPGVSSLGKEPANCKFEQRTLRSITKRHQKFPLHNLVFLDPVSG